MVEIIPTWIKSQDLSSKKTRYLFFTSYKYEWISDIKEREMKVKSEQKINFFYIFICQPYSSLSQPQLWPLYPHQHQSPPLTAVHLLHQLILFTSLVNNNAITSFFFLYTITSNNGIGSNSNNTSTTPIDQQRHFSPVPSNHPFLLQFLPLFACKTWINSPLAIAASWGKDRPNPF